MNRTVLSVALVFCAASPAAARQFVASDVNGVRVKQTGKIVISNDDSAIRATQGKKTLVTVPSARRTAPPPAPAPAPAGKIARVPAALAEYFHEAAQRYSLDPLLLAAVARQESRFQPHAVSPVGARGVMQLMPATAASLGVTDSFDARQNILGGAKYLRMMLDQFRGDVDLSLAAYNAGPGAVRKYRGIPPYRETTAYVAAIRRDYDASRR